MSKVQPLKPSEVLSIKKERILNEMIVEEYDLGRAVVLQQEVVKRICQKLGVTSDQVYERDWLDVEGLFRKAGWRVMRNGGHKPSFTFDIPSLPFPG